MKRFLMVASQRAVDIAVLSAAYWSAFYLRFEGEMPLQMFKRLLFTWPYVVGFQLVVLAAFNVPRFAWRYVGLRESLRILLAASVASILLLAVRIVAPIFLPVTGYGQWLIVPFGVLVIDWLLAFLGVTGVRILRRVLAERVAADHYRKSARVREVPTLLIGAGRAGLMVAKEIADRPDLGIQPVGFLDDDPAKLGTVLHGVRVLGATRELATLATRTGAEQVLVTIANATGTEMRRIVEACEVTGLPVKTVPGIYEIVGGKVNLSRIRDVAIEDLLRRPPVQLDTQGLAEFLQRKTVMITGAGGSIGSELCRQVAHFAARRMVLVERYENALVDIYRELQEIAPNLEIRACIADITDVPRMQRLMRELTPDVIFHAAAHKHVPMMEDNPGEAIKNNVLGTKLMTQYAAEHDVGHFVFVSTDKAVNPTSIMGASKRVAELYVQGMAQRSTKTRFVSVRFGNVLGSTGSVIPLFKRQIAMGGPVTVTHPDMKRYFMTIPEAVQLVLEAAALGKGGEVFVLDMGEPVRIMDLAKDLIRLSGFEPERDIKIAVTGVRPGEKLFEELATSEELATRTKHEKIFVGKVKLANWDVLNRGIDELLRSTDQSDRTIYEALKDLIPEFAGGERDESAKVIPLGSSARQKESTT